MRTEFSLLLIISCFVRTYVYTHVNIPYGNTAMTAPISHVLDFGCKVNTFYPNVQKRYKLYRLFCTDTASLCYLSHSTTSPFWSDFCTSMSLWLEEPRKRRSVLRRAWTKGPSTRTSRFCKKDITPASPSARSCSHV